MQYVILFRDELDYEVVGPFPDQKSAMEYACSCTSQVWQVLPLGTPIKRSH